MTIRIEVRGIQTNLIENKTLVTFWVHEPLNETIERVKDIWTVTINERHDQISDGLIEEITAIYNGATQWITHQHSKTQSLRTT